MFTPRSITVTQPPHPEPRFDGDDAPVERAPRRAFAARLANDGAEPGPRLASCAVFTRLLMRARYALVSGLPERDLATLANAEDVDALQEGAEYVHLLLLERGVIHRGAMRPRPGNLLPRPAVQPATWDVVIAQVAAYEAQVLELLGVRTPRPAQPNAVR